MLDMKHKNIGATVSMLNMIHELTPGDELPIEITKLFMAESDDCDHKHETGQCTFHAEEDLTKGDSFTTFKCCIGECPLGPLVDGEFKATANSIDLSDTFIGPCSGCGGSVTQSNCAHVDDHHQVCQSCFDEKEKMKS